MMLRRINIKNRVLRTVLYTGSALRIKHFRGHGIHSPFVYSMIRQAFMKRRLTSSDASLYNDLRRVRCSRRVARQLQNVLNYCRYKDYSLITSADTSDSNTPESRLIVVMHTVDVDTMRVMIHKARQYKTGVAVVYPRHNRARFIACRKEVGSGKYLSIDNRRFILFFSEERLPVQHFKL